MQRRRVRAFDEVDSSASDRNRGVHDRARRRLVLPESLARMTVQREHSIAGDERDEVKVGLVDLFTAVIISRSIRFRCAAEQLIIDISHVTPVTRSAIGQRRNWNV